VASYAQLRFGLMAVWRTIFAA